MHTETVFLRTIDGAELETDLVRTDAPHPRAVVIVAHPHPLHGGNRHDRVVAAIQRAALAEGCHSIAPDFRGVGNSTGTHDNGDAERLDLAAACELATMIEPDCPIVMAGYSFGALVALNVNHPDIAAWLAVAPPLAMAGSDPIAAANHRPKILVAAEHDQFTDAAAMTGLTRDWTRTSVRVALGVDHFLVVDTDAIVGAALTGTLEAIGA